MPIELKLQRECIEGQIRVGNFKNPQQVGPSVVLFYLGRTWSRKRLIIFIRRLIAIIPCQLLQMMISQI